MRDNRNSDQAEKIGEVVKEAVDQAVQAPVDILESILAGGGKSVPPAAKKAQAWRDMAETAELRGKLQQSGRGRDVEGEIAAVRAKKVQTEQEKHEEEMALAKVLAQKEEEKKMANQEDVAPAGKQPRGSAPWIAGGTKEKGIRQSV